jgi:hypothetical protein
MVVAVFVAVLLGMEDAIIAESNDSPSARDGRVHSTISQLNCIALHSEQSISLLESTVRPYHPHSLVHDLHNSLTMATPVLADEFRCAYPFKFCNNWRATKANGDLHKLCQEHRDRANLHQKNLAVRRRQIREQLRLASASARAADQQLAFADIADLLDDDAFLHVRCSADDLKAVDALLSDTESDD